MSADALTALFAEVLNVPAAELSEDTSPDNTPAWDRSRRTPQWPSRRWV